MKKTITKRCCFPKTNVPAATDDHPANFKTLSRTFTWASVFLKRVAHKYGDNFVCNKLRSWKWQLSTCFSGVGCAELAALSLQTAAAKYTTKKASDPRMLSPKVVLASSCEVDVDCRHVLYETFVEKGKGGAREHCIFADVLKTDRADKRAFCVVHNKLCPLLPAKEKDRIRVNVSGPPCVSFSMMGNRLQTKDVQFETHEAMYENISPNVDIQIIENVPEYEEKGYEQSLACQKLGEDFDGKSFKIDPRVLGLPTARARVYILAWKKAKFSWSPDFSLMEFLDVVTSQVTLDASEYWWMDIPRTKLTPSTEANLRDYQELGFRMADLCQMAHSGRGRHETKDGALPTLTTNSGKIFHKDQKRYLSPTEMLNTHCIPTTDRQAKLSGTPRLKVDKVRDSSLVKMGGNAMNLPCVGCAILACVFGLELRTG